VLDSADKDRENVNAGINFINQNTGIKWVIGGFLMHLVLGWVYLWGNVSIYISSYFYHYQGISRVNVAFSIMIGAQGICTIFGPYLLRKMGPTRWLTFGSSIFLVGTFLSTFFTNFVAFCIFYSVCFGVGVGCCYLVPITCSWQYFPHRKGLVTGIIVGGFGFGSFIFNFISTAIINSDNLKPDLMVDGSRIFSQQRIIEMTPVMIRVLVFTWAILMITAITLIKGNPHEWESVEDESHKNDLKLQLLEKSEHIHFDDPQSMEKIKIFLRERPFYSVLNFRESIISTNSLLLWFIIWFSSSYGMFIAHVFKHFGIMHINDDFFMTTVGSFGAIMNGGSRSIWSSILDKHSFKQIFGILLVIQICLSGSLVSIANIGGESSYGKPLYLIWICASFFCLGGHFSMFPTVTSRLYGVVTGSEVYGILFTAFSAATISGRIISDLLLDTYGYNVIFYTLWWFSIFAGFLLFFFDIERTIDAKAQKIAKIHSIEMSKTV
jgi:MFS transporter, OFA family, oxalate/formate antiporter